MKKIIVSVFLLFFFTVVGCVPDLGPVATEQRVCSTKGDDYYSLSFGKETNRLIFAKGVAFERLTYGFRLAERLKNYPFILLRNLLITLIILNPILLNSHLAGL